MSRHYTVASTAAAASIAALLVLAPAGLAAEPEVAALQDEIDGLKAKVALLERHVTRIEERVIPARLSAVEGKGAAIERFELLESQRPERKPFGKL